MKKNGRVCVFLFFLLGMITMVKAQQDYESWLKAQNKKFTEFKDARDQAFSDFLKNEWRKMQVMQGLAVDDTPKPVAPPVAEPVKGPVHEPSPLLELPTLPPPEEKPVAPPPPEISGQPVAFSFFESPVTLYTASSLSGLAAMTKPGPEAIASFWQQCSQIDYVPLLKQLLQARKILSLNDWGYFRLVLKLAQILWPDNFNNARLFAWFTLCKSGFDVRVGYDAENVHLLLAAQGKLYGRPFFTLNGKNYYLCDESQTKKDVESIYTYDATYPGADAPLGLGLEQAPEFSGDEKKIELKAQWGDSTLEMNLHINPGLIAFYRDYPQTELGVYFKAPLSKGLLPKLASMLRPRLLGRSEAEALNLLLGFVQLSFKYETDEQQFGREKPLFAEETLFYPASDCEDRSVLFSNLVKSLLGLDVVGLDYPGHVATAVRTNAPVHGDHLAVQGKEYLICDPTYLHAHIGQSMPQFKQITPELIRW